MIVRGATSLAEGWHREWGGAHAESEALHALARVPADATLVVTLEPCSSRGGEKKQPPCVEALLAAGVRRVVIGESDPDPRHAGRGLAQLRAAGVAVVVAPRGAVPESLLAGFRAHRARARPYVFVKWAQSLDGCWSTGRADQRWISSEAARAAVHQLRARVDALLVGSETVRVDDPQLTARPPGPRPLTRVVVDSRGRTPASAQLFTVRPDAPTWWITRRGVAAATPAGVTRLELDDPHDVTGELLPQLHRLGIRRLLVEGGPTVVAAFLRAGVVDRAWIFVAPRTFGGPAASLPTLAAASSVHLQDCGGDAWFDLSF